MKHRILHWAATILLAVAAGLLCQAAHTYGGTSDLWLAYGAAGELLQGNNPYNYPTDGWPSNPMPTVLAMVPFAALGIPLGWTGAVCIGLAVGLYTHASLARGEAWRLFALLSLPAWWTIKYSQWGILLLAIWFVPQLAPLALLKPHQGAIIGLLNTTRRRAAAVVAILALCFLLAPGWVGDWLAQTGSTYDGTIPVLGAGAAGLLVLLRRHDREALLYAGLLITPMRPWHDPIALFATLGSWQAVALLAALSWLALPLADAGLPFGLASVLTTYLPVGALLLAERWAVTQPVAQPAGTA